MEAYVSPTKNTLNANLKDYHKMNTYVLKK